jgi:predicted regulator of Ras-like GTPase activity (Roadblock/LC7/MglB family)
LVYIPGDHGDVMKPSIGGEAKLTTPARENVKFGLILLEMRYAADNLQRVVG